MQVRVAPLKLQKGKYQIFGQWETTCHDVLCYQKEPGWKVRQLRTECQKTDKILRTKTEILKSGVLRLLLQVLLFIVAIIISVKGSF